MAELIMILRNWPNGTIMVIFLLVYFLLAVGIFSFIFHSVFKSGGFSKFIFLSRVATRIHLKQ
jgi:hypothetical protein